MICINVGVTALVADIVSIGCLKTARNPAISVDLLPVLIQKVSKLIDAYKV